MDSCSIIVAIASPPGPSPRGIVRLSGPGTFDLLSTLGLVVPHAERRAVSGNLSLPGPDGSRPLPCRVLLFPGDRSYTAQESAELHLPGHPALLDRVVDAIVATASTGSHDVRCAEPGEFTARAFFHGRLGLTEAEGVAATIAARSDAELTAARALAGGAVGRAADDAAEALAAVLALVEAGIDFTDEEDVVAITADDLRRRLGAIEAALIARLERRRGAEHTDAAPRVVFVGAPNAGKSTLFNALLGRPRAVVTDLEGTTRDAIVEPLALTGPAGPMTVLLVDVAGHDDADSLIKRAAQAVARLEAGRAALRLCCVPVDAPLDEPARDDATIIVRTKHDRAPRHDHATGDVSVCAPTGAGLDRLRDMIGERLVRRQRSAEAERAALLPRHEANLRAAQRAIADALELVGDASPGANPDAPELVAAHLRAGLDALHELTGQHTPDDVLGRIFASFCIGK